MDSDIIGGCPHIAGIDNAEDGDGDGEKKGTASWNNNKPAASKRLFADFFCDGKYEYYKVCEQKNKNSIEHEAKPYVI